MNKVAIIGAGVGGLSTAAELAKAGLDVTVLEAHVDPGGCAATFFHQGYRFDAGATLAGGFAPGAPMDLLGQRFDIDWEALPADIAMQIHLPDGETVTRWSDPNLWQTERLRVFGPQAEPFWHWQERTADELWHLALRLPPWPPQTLRETVKLTSNGLSWLKFISSNDYTQLFSDALWPTSHHLKDQSQRLRQYVDGQLLISAQATSGNANALYSAAALDLARQGVAHIPGGMGQIAQKLADAVKNFGGQVRYRQAVTRVRHKAGQFEIETQRGETYLAGTVIFNLPPWNIREILGEQAPLQLKKLPPQPRDGRGAFVIYLGVAESAIPKEAPLHQQILIREPFGEGNSLFLSTSPAWDFRRAPQGRRALTISTHTQLAPWWHLHENDPAAYEERKERYTDQILAAIEQIFPGLQASTDLIMPGTPVTFQRFTRRAWGWVGGFPQTSLFSAWGPRLAPGLWLVGDSIFPGQSVPAVGLGGLRVAQAILATLPKTQRTPRIQGKKLLRAEDLT